jgi:hypothetical protein
MSVHVVQDTVTLHYIFHLPLSGEAYIQFQELQNLVQDINIQQQADQWTYLWGSATLFKKGL